MNSKTLPKLNNKSRSLMKSMKPPIIPPMLLKNKEKLPPVPKNVISKMIENDINSNNNKVEQEIKPSEPNVKIPEPNIKPPEPNVKPPEPNIKLLEPKIKPSEPKLKPPEPKIKPSEPKINPPEPKIKPPEPKIKPPEPKIKQSEPKIKPPEPKFKPPEPKIKPSEPKIKPPEPKFKPPEPKIKPSEPKFKPPEPKIKPPQTKIKPPEPNIKPSEPNIKPSEPNIKPPEPNIKPIEPKIKPFDPKLKFSGSKINSVESTTKFTSKEANDVDLKENMSFDSVKEEYPKNILSKNKFHEKKNIFDKVRNISLISKNVESSNPYEIIEKGRLYSDKKEKTKHSTSTVTEKGTIIKKEISLLDNEMTKNILNNSKEIQQKSLKNGNFNIVDISTQGKGSTFKISTNLHNKVEQTEVYINSVTKKNIMIGIPNEAKKIGPLSTFKESKLIRNTHYINAFSRFDGNYIGKVTGPPTPISNLDKTPQNHNEKKDFQNEFQINNFSNNLSPFSDYSCMMNFPLYNFNSNLKNSGIANPPFCFYPGMCIPLYPYDPLYYQNIFMNNLNESEEKNRKEEINNDNKRIKKKNKKIKKKNVDNTMVASGHLKPLQFRNGAEWSSEDEKYLNADIYFEEEKKINRENKNKSRSKYIGNSQWYEIEHKLNNSRGVIEDEDEDEEEDEDKDEEEEEEEEDEDEDEYNNENEDYNKEENKKYYKELKKKKKCKSTKKNIEDMDNFNFDNLYKNYKIEYLKEKLKWANEYLKKKKKNEELSNSNSITYNPLRKKHIERLDDIAHLFLPKNKKYQNLFDLAMNISKISNDDKNDIINILLSCRELEKLIEEQHCILDMLDNDLKEVNASLKLPSNWDNFENFELLQENILNSEENGLSLNNTPLFIKGKVSLIPKNLETFFEETEQSDKKEGYNTMTNMHTEKNTLTKMNTEKNTITNMNIEKNTITNTKFSPKLIKSKVKAKIPLLLKNTQKS
ncbi:conserved Plasmodium protein, unknown function [Plasmodium gallinaceum]|uniref:Uncharacterized protein n=1 Tax=Plasmodium gallinaceum TaxID=5849 RepID=A0A1J1GLU1_PLAGA|nr:conserved Plasmodium protein, unknown function [Plasmodium gallinaceum]CRG93400.1 conserved Plasmodium protein, unknown function [Plasmodium gallinaceum]